MGSQPAYHRNGIMPMTFNYRYIDLSFRVVLADQASTP
jgi:hypothetical protein